MLYFKWSSSQKHSSNTTECPNNLFFRIGEVTSYSDTPLHPCWSSGAKTDTIRELSYPALLLVVNSLFPPMLQRLSSGAANLSCSTSCSSFLISLPSSYMEHRCLVTSRMLINHVLLLVVPSLLPPTEQFHHLPPPPLFEGGEHVFPSFVGDGAHFSYWSEERQQT